MANKAIYNALYGLVNTLADNYGFDSDEGIEVIESWTDVNHIAVITALLEKAPKKVETHDELMDKFGPLGLNYAFGDTYTTEDMEQNDRDMLIRSLREAYENEWLYFDHDNHDDLCIHFLPT